ncbi:hypothetical protein B0H14DRAFT_2601155 [Mycena olivaceomarginata]|nr:hypothetical protein B0H14DRAFT_2601155 [Mycena olivaceomarginata]
MDLDPPSRSNNYVSDRSAWRALCQDFESAADMSKAVLSIILNANHKQISTESLLRVAAVLNISVSGDRNLRLKVRSVIGKHAQSVSTADTNAYSSTSIADFFKSFETHHKPVLLSIAALHHIQIPQSATVDSIVGPMQSIFSLILQYLWPMAYSCLTVLIYTTNGWATIRELKSLSLEHDDADSIDQLHRKLKHHITTLRRGNNVECSQEQEQAARAQYVKQLQT